MVFRSFPFLRFLFLPLLVLMGNSTFSQSICEIQGNGANSPFVGQSINTEGIITAVFSGSGTVGGYFIEQPDCDADPMTSNGILVYTQNTGALAVGTRVQVTGTVAEFNGLTEITNPSAVVLGSGTVPPH